jgi:hypothetical protein
VSPEVTFIQKKKVIVEGQRKFNTIVYYIQLYIAAMILISLITKSEKNGTKNFLIYYVVQKHNTASKKYFALYLVYIATEKGTI